MNGMRGRRKIRFQMIDGILKKEKYVENVKLGQDTNDVKNNHESLAVQYNIFCYG